MRHRRKRYGFFQIVLNRRETMKYAYPERQADYDFVQRVATKAFNILAKYGWQTHKVEVVGIAPSNLGPVLLHTYRYRDGDTVYGPP